MIVRVKKRSYRMSKKEYQGLLKVASENVPFGIYAIEKDGQAELMNIQCKSMSELKRYKRTYKEKGFKVYENK